jgi:hypothetical protein
MHPRTQVNNTPELVCKAQVLHDICVHPQKAARLAAFYKARTAEEQSQAVAQDSASGVLQNAEQK